MVVKLKKIYSDIPTNRPLFPAIFLRDKKDSVKILDIKGDYIRQKNRKNLFYPIEEKKEKKKEDKKEKKKKIKKKKQKKKN